MGGKHCTVEGQLMDYKSYKLDTTSMDKVAEDIKNNNHMGPAWP